MYPGLIAELCLIETHDAGEGHHRKWGDVRSTLLSWLRDRRTRLPHSPERLRCCLRCLPLKLLVEQTAELTNQGHQPFRVLFLRGLFAKCLPGQFRLFFHVASFWEFQRVLRTL